VVTWRRSVREISATVLSRLIAEMAALNVLAERNRLIDVHRYRCAGWHGRVQLAQSCDARVSHIADCVQHGLTPMRPCARMASHVIQESGHQNLYQLLT